MEFVIIIKGFKEDVNDRWEFFMSDAENVKLKSHFKILDKEVTVITNSLLLKDYIKNGLSLSFLKKKIHNSLMMSFILKNPYDVQEALASLSELTGKILRAIHHNYFIFHASAFSYDGQATMVLGYPETGKSSTCFFAGLSGAKIITDEPVLIDKESFLVVPFRYLIKIEGFSKNFQRLNFSTGWDFNRNRAVKEGHFDFNLFTKNDLKKLEINLESRETMLKNIIFLEKKKYDSVIHLYNHCLNSKNDPIELFKSLNNLIKDTNIKFIPDMISNLKNDYKIKNLLQLTTKRRSYAQRTKA